MHRNQRVLEDVWKTPRSNDRLLNQDMTVRSAYLCGNLIMQTPSRKAKHNIMHIYTKLLSLILLLPKAAIRRTMRV